jgi:hypothetical protein
LLDKLYAKRLKSEHGADAWLSAARPARLNANQKLRYSLIEGKRRTWSYSRLLEIEPCRKLDCSTREAPFARRVLHQSFLGKNLLEHVVIGKRLLPLRRLIGRTPGSFAFAVDQRNRRKRIGNAPIGVASPKLTAYALELIAGLTVVNPSAIVS